MIHKKQSTAKPPPVCLPFHPEENPVEYRNEVSGVILTNKAIPAFFNDIENIRPRVNQGRLWNMPEIMPS